MRFQSLHILREIVDENVVHVLSVLEFLVRAFAVVGDFEVRSTDVASSLRS